MQEYKVNPYFKKELFVDCLRSIGVEASIVKDSILYDRKKLLSIPKYMMPTMVYNNLEFMESQATDYFETKNAKVRRLVSQGDYKQALQICKDWSYEDPTHRDILRLGYECLMYPDFYKQLGRDTDYQYQEAVRVLKEVYLK